MASLRRSVMQRVESPVEVREVYERLLGSVRRAVVGKDRVVDLSLISLLAGGHVLLTDIPGVGKTTLARAISSSIAADFSRIQFTPDLLPSDITGTSIYDPREARFRWMPGPVFAPVLLADGEGLLQRHLRRLPARDGLLPDEQHQDRPVQLS